jgi:Flp pilus assembly protein TadG
MPESRTPNRLTALLSRFRRDRRGNIAIIFALSLLPILTGIGCATDYTNATRIRAKLQAAADAAAVASVSKNSAAYLQAIGMTANGPVSAGQTEIQNIFNGNAYNFLNLLQGGPTLTTATVTKTGVNLTSNVQFSAQVPVVFMKVWGWQTMTVGGTSAATSSLPKYIDFYLMLDVSGSMGLPSTTAEANRMQAINPDNWQQYQPTGCTIACHFTQPPLSPLPKNSGNQLSKSACMDQKANQPYPQTFTQTQKYNTGNYCLGYDISRISQSAYAQLLTNHSGKLPPYKYTDATSSSPVAQPTAFYSTSAQYPNDPVLTPVSSCPTAGTDACIQLRLDAVGYAVSQLLSFATSPAYELIPNEFRVGLYPYITQLYSTYTNGLQSNLTGSTLTTAANNLAALLDTNTNSSLGSGGTNQDAALSTMNGLITNVGDGSSTTSTLPYVFIITDGAVTPQTKGVPFGGWSGSNHDTVIANPDTNCTAMKNKGIKIAILYIPFQPIQPPVPSFAGDEDDYANNNIPNIPASLQACASNNFFYTANTPQDITNLLQTMFKQALSEAHVTN